MTNYFFVCLRQLLLFQKNQLVHHFDLVRHLCHDDKKLFCFGCGSKFYLEIPAVNITKIWTLFLPSNRNFIDQTLVAVVFKLVIKSFIGSVDIKWPRKKELERFEPLPGRRVIHTIITDENLLMRSEEEWLQLLTVVTYFFRTDKLITNEGEVRICKSKKCIFKYTRSVISWARLNSTESLLQKKSALKEFDVSFKSWHPCKMDGVSWIKSKSGLV